VNHPEKLAQRDAAAMRDLMEVCCLWVAIYEPIRLHVGEGAGFDKLEEMFYDGTLALNKTMYNFPPKKTKPCKVSRPKKQNHV